MKPKNFILIALLFAIIGAGLWWFMRPTEAPSVKTALVSTPAKNDLPKTVTLPTQVELPKTPAVPAKTGTAAASAEPADPNDDPQADLKTAIPDIARLERTGDLLGLYEIYTLPDKLYPMIIQRIRAVQQQTAIDAAGDPRLQQQLEQIREGAARTYEALETQTPTYNETGDEATYMYSAYELTHSAGYGPKTFIKINGKWYIKPDPGTLETVKPQTN